MDNKTLPIAFLNRMESLLGSDYQNYLASLAKSPVRGFQINTKKITVDRFVKLFPCQIDPIPYTANGFYLREDVKIGKTPFHHAGMLYMQEPSAMIPAESVSIPLHSYVLDVCAAPGGKTVAILNALRETGIVVANEINPTRSKILLSNIERMGFSNSIVTNQTPSLLRQNFTDVFDFVFVDTPCSGEGMFRKDDTAITEWKENTPLLCQKRSLEILEEVSHCLKKGGFLIYSTCTFSKEENEEVIASFLRNHSYDIVEIPDKIQNVTKAGIKTDYPTDRTRRFYPFYAKGEGQFVAVLKKKEEEMPSRHRKYILPLKDSKLAAQFIDNNLNMALPLFQYHQNIVTLKEPFPVPDSHVLSVGVKVGESEKNRFVPHHQFFSAYGTAFKSTVDLKINDPRIQAYISGEEITVTAENGWCAVLIEGVPVGGGKVVNGKLKNHYPKGLRQK